MRMNKNECRFYDALQSEIKMKKKKRVGLILAICIPLGVLFSVVMCIVGYYYRGVEVINGYLRIANSPYDISDNYNPDIIDYDDLVRLRIVDDDTRYADNSFRLSTRHKIRNLSIDSVDYEVSFTITCYGPEEVSYSGHWIVRMEFVDFRWRVAEVVNYSSDADE